MFLVNFIRQHFRPLIMATVSLAVLSFPVEGKPMAFAIAVDLIDGVGYSGALNLLAIILLFVARGPAPNPLYNPQNKSTIVLGVASIATKGSSVVLAAYVFGQYFVVDVTTAVVVAMWLFAFAILAHMARIDLISIDGFEGSTARISWARVFLVMISFGTLFGSTGMPVPAGTKAPFAAVIIYMIGVAPLIPTIVDCYVKHVWQRMRSNK